MGKRRQVVETMVVKVKQARQHVRVRRHTKA
jgi:hypothetical protein